MSMLHTDTDGTTFISHVFKLAKEYLVKEWIIFVISTHVVYTR